MDTSSSQEATKIVFVVIKQTYKDTIMDASASRIQKNNVVWWTYKALIGGEWISDSKKNINLNINFTNLKLNRHVTNNTKYEINT